MLKKRTPKRLSLHRETLRALDAPELERVAAGLSVVTCKLTCPVSDCRRTCINNTCTC